MVATLQVLEDKANASLNRIKEIEQRLNQSGLSEKEEQVLYHALDKHRWIVMNALRQKRKFSRKMMNYAKSTQ